MFLTIFTAYQCKVHRVVARKVHPSLLGVGKNYAWATKCPHAYCAETPVAWDSALAIGGRVPEAVVTFEPREEALGAWQEVKGEAMSVNEALYAGTIEGTVRLDGS